MLNPYVKPGKAKLAKGSAASVKPAKPAGKAKGAIRRSTGGKGSVLRSGSC